MPRFPIGPDGKYVFPRLTRQQLRAIYERNPCPEVKELLWEIHRLQILLQRADQLQRMLGDSLAHPTALVLERFRQELAGEPCVEEREEWKRDLFGKPDGAPYTRQKTRRD